MKNALSKPKIKEAAALQIICVIAWLWCVPVIDWLQSYSYGNATRALIISFLPLTLGISISENVRHRYNLKFGKPALIIGSVLLMTGLVFYEPLRCYLWHGYMRHSHAFRFFGFVLLGYGLRSMRFSLKIRSFWSGLLWLVFLYGLYNLLIFCRHNLNPEVRTLWVSCNIVYAITGFLVVVMLWQTLTTAEIRRLLDKCPKIMHIVAGLFWGILLVAPASHYYNRWLAIIMFIMAPVVAYIMTVIVRLSFSMVSYLVKGILANKFWWSESCCWWINKEENNERIS